MLIFKIMLLIMMALKFKRYLPSASLNFPSAETAYLKLLKRMGNPIQGEGPSQRERLSAKGEVICKGRGFCKGRGLPLQAIQVRDGASAIRIRSP